MSRSSRAPVSRSPPRTSYLWADVGHLTNDSVAFCARMLAETAVAATPGVDFDRERGHRFLRLSYCGGEAEMAEAAERLRGWLGT